MWYTDSEVTQPWRQTGARHPMRIGYLQLGQPADTTPTRFVKKNAAAALLSGMKVEPVQWNERGQVTVVREVKHKALPSSDALRFFRPQFTVIEVLKGRKRINVAESEGLLLQYPLPDQSSYAKDNRRRVWGGVSRCSTPSEEAAQ